MKNIAHRSIMIAGHIVLVLGLSMGLSTLGVAQDDNREDTVCVTGQDGNWSCGPRNNPPKAYPLPDNGVISSASEQGRSAQTPDQPRSLEQARYDNFLAPLAKTDATSPASNSPLPAQSLIGSGHFSLRIAEVGAETDIRELAEQFALDSSLVYVAITGTGDSERRVVLLGRFSTPAQSRQAMNGFPASIRQMRPAIERLDSFEKVIPLGQLYATKSAVATPRPSARTSPASAIKIEPVPERPPIKQPAEAAAASTVAEPVIETPSAVKPVAVVSIDQHDAIKAPVISDTPINAEEAMPAPQTSTPPVRTPTQAPVTQAPVTRAPALIADESPQAVQDEPAESARQPTVSAERRSSNRALSPFRDQPQPAISPASDATTPEPGDRSKYQQLNARHYLIQLGNLASRDAALALFNSAGLDPMRCYLIEVDEGAGPRWLLLMGGFDSVKSATNRLSSLPDVLRNPWVRRVSPLQRTRG